MNRDTAKYSRHAVCENTVGLFQCLLDQSSDLDQVWKRDYRCV